MPRSIAPADAGAGEGAAGQRFRAVPRPDLPLALARLHADLAVGAAMELSFRAGPVETVSPGPAGVVTDPPAADDGNTWLAGPLADVVAGAGFDPVEVTRSGDGLAVRAVRARTLPAVVGPGMRMLVCGLNPSLVSADAGFAYATATNRFWTAAVEAGLVTTPRRPFDVLATDGIGLTDMVKRATARSHHLAAGEYQAGAERLRRLVCWLRPGVVLFVGLEGWRAAIDRRARPGSQPDGFGGVAAYVMPSTSGANAHARLADLVDHFRAAQALTAPHP